MNVRSRIGLLFFGAVVPIVLITCTNPLLELVLANVADYKTPDSEKPVLAFNITAEETNNPTVAIQLTSDDIVTGWMLTTVPEPPADDDKDWAEIAPTEYPFAVHADPADTEHTLWAWAKNEAGLVNDPISDSVLIHPEPWTISIADYPVLTAHDPIVITFSEPMSATVSLSGTMGEADHLQEPTPEGDANGILTVTPGAANGLWTAGADLNLEIGTTTALGVPVEISLSRDVFNGVCVSATRGSAPSGPGAGGIVTPVAHIDEGITTAAATYKSVGVPSDVRVAGGTYEVNWVLDSHRVEVVEGVSLRGSYDEVMTSRSLSPQTSRIQDESSSSGGNQYNPERAVSIDGSAEAITAATIIDGLEIKGGTCQFSTALYVKDASPTISGNAVIAGGNTADAYVYGIYVTGTSTAVISDNTINDSATAGGAGVDYAYGVFRYDEGGSGTGSVEITDNLIRSGTASAVDGKAICIQDKVGSRIERNYLAPDTALECYGLMCSGTAGIPVAVNNVIDSGLMATSASGESYGIFALNSNPVIRNNTILVGHESAPTAGTAYGLYLVLTTSSTIVENNIFAFRPSGSTYAAYCIYEGSSAADVASLHNNDMHGFGTVPVYFYRDIDDSMTFTSIAAMESDLNAELANSAGDNTDADPVMNPGPDPETIYRLTASSPAAVTAGGLNGDTAGWSFTNDKTGTTRTGIGTTGWSMGAYEKD